ncbi:MAG: hypothetical protein ACREF4_11190, partial [Gammaproteobacteria bacterium]
MLQFKNQPLFAGALHLLPNAEGADALFAVVKGTFALDDRPAVAPEPLPLAPATDMAAPTRPGARPTTALDVSLAVSGAAHESEKRVKSAATVRADARNALGIQARVGHGTFT